MTTETRNEAADLLRDYLDGGPTPDLDGKSELQTLDEALAAERRATVQRIRERFLATTGLYPDLTATEVEVAAMVFGDLNAILDAEAAR